MRPLETAVAPWIAREISNPNVQRMLTQPPHPYRLADAEEFVARHSGMPGIWLIEADGPVGCVSIRTHLGYWLAQSAWGNGYMAEAAGAAVSHWFSSGADRLTSSHMHDNRASGRVLAKLGFRPDGTGHAWAQFRGAEVMLRRVVLTHADWTARLPAA